MNTGYKGKIYVHFLLFILSRLECLVSYNGLSSISMNLSIFLKILNLYTYSIQYHRQKVLISGVDLEYGKALR